jgi:predicted nicotinamide N-methyase
VQRTPLINNRGTDRTFKGLQGRMNYQTKTFSIPLHDRVLTFVQPQDPLALIDNLTPEQARLDKYQPYWVENWPSAETCISFLTSYTFTNALRVIELGCGLGVLSTILQTLGHSIIATDIALDGCTCTAINCKTNCGKSKVVCCDMKQLPFKNYVPDLILASDILYEEKMHHLFLSALDTLLTDTNKAWLADPCRRGWDTFKKNIGEKYSLTLLHSEDKVNGLRVEIVEIKRKKY